MAGLQSISGFDIDLKRCFAVLLSRGISASEVMRMEYSDFIFWLDVCEAAKQLEDEQWQSKKQK